MFVEKKQQKSKQTCETRLLCRLYTQSEPDICMPNCALQWKLYSNGEPRMRLGRVTPKILLYKKYARRTECRIVVQCVIQCKIEDSEEYKAELLKNCIIFKRLHKNNETQQRVSCLSRLYATHIPLPICNAIRLFRCAVRDN